MLTKKTCGNPGELWWMVLTSRRGSVTCGRKRHTYMEIFCASSSHVSWWSRWASPRRVDDRLLLPQGQDLHGGLSQNLMLRLGLCGSQNQSLRKKSTRSISNRGELTPKPQSTTVNGISVCRIEHYSTWPGHIVTLSRLLPIMSSPECFLNVFCVAY